MTQADEPGAPRRSDAILREIRRMPPVDTRYVAGLWHRDRLSFGGHMAEMRVAVQSLRNRGPGPRVRFLVIGRARSGTTLLGRLLNAQDRIACTGEVLSRDMWAPGAYLERVARKSPFEVWGAKLLSYQMVQVHRMRDPVAFLHGLEERGFRFIHLVRSTLHQTLSLAVAQSSRRFHSDRVTGDGPGRVHLDPEDFAARLRWSDALARYESRIFADLPHRRLSYETDLLRPQARAAAIRDLCAWFEVPFAPVEAPLRKLLPEEPADLVENWDEVVQGLHRADLDHLLTAPAVSDAKHRKEGDEQGPDRRS